MSQTRYSLANQYICAFVNTCMIIRERERNIRLTGWADPYILMKILVINLNLIWGKLEHSSFLFLDRKTGGYILSAP